MKGGLVRVQTTKTYFVKANTRADLTIGRGEQHPWPVYIRKCPYTFDAQRTNCGYIWLYLDAEVLVLPPPVLSLGLCFCWLPNFVVIQLPPTRAQFLLLCLCACPARGFCHSPRRFVYPSPLYCLIHSGG